MIRHALKILQQTLQDFQSVSDHFETLYIKRLSPLLRRSQKQNHETMTECHTYQLFPELFKRLFTPKPNNFRMVTKSFMNISPFLKNK